MKTIIIIEDDPWTVKMYVKFFQENIKEHELHFITFEWLEDAKKAAIFHPDCAMYILDGTVRGGHTDEVIDLFPKEKVVVISGEDGYVKKCKDKGIQAFNKPFTWSLLQENKTIFETILNK